MPEPTPASRRDLTEVGRLAALASDSLVKRDRKIVKLYRDGVSPTTIASHAGVSRVRVHQIAKAAAAAETQETDQ